MQARYQITERNIASNPENTDPKAQIRPVVTGVFDLRDTCSIPPVIVATSCTLKALRAMQARLNTASVLG